MIEVLNFLGECCFKIDDKEQALRAWEKSLEINPNQENSKKMIERLRG
jgi:predicted negative regulator of RcsB-dependent stress response